MKRRSGLAHDQLCLDQRRLRRIPIQNAQQLGDQNAPGLIDILSDRGHRRAEAGARRWVDNNLNVYSRSGRLLEKYNVEEAGAAGVGGEYVVQDGFGWTNAILLQFMNRLGIDK